MKVTVVIKGGIFSSTAFTLKLTYPIGDLREWVKERLLDGWLIMDNKVAVPVASISYIEVS